MTPDQLTLVNKWMEVRNWPKEWTWFDISYRGGVLSGQAKWEGTYLAVRKLKIT